jgi:hypothetical protein
MFAKSIIAAAALTSAIAMIPADQAQAKTYIDIDVHLGGGYGGGWYPGYTPYPVYSPGWGISCGTARHIVKSHGFYNVNVFDCSKPVYQYTAWKFGQPYKVKVNMAGNIIKVVHL